KATGYFRLRTWLANRGATVKDAHLYQPLFSPWEGEPEFERQYQAIRKHTLVSRDRCHVLWRTLQQALHLPGEVVECGVFRGGPALLAARTIGEGPIRQPDETVAEGRGAAGAGVFGSPRETRQPGLPKTPAPATHLREAPQLHLFDSFQGVAATV